MSTIQNEENILIPLLLFEIELLYVSHDSLQAVLHPQACTSTAHSSPSFYNGEMESPGKGAIAQLNGDRRQNSG